MSVRQWKEIQEVLRRVLLTPTNTEDPSRNSLIESRPLDMRTVKTG